MSCTVQRRGKKLECCVGCGILVELLFLDYFVGVISCLADFL